MLASLAETDGRVRPHELEDAASLAADVSLRRRLLRAGVWWAGGVGALRVFDRGLEQAGDGSRVDSDTTMATSFIELVEEADPIGSPESDARVIGRDLEEALRAVAGSVGADEGRRGGSRGGVGRRRAQAWLLGALYERCVELSCAAAGEGANERRSRGLFYTPGWLVGETLAGALEPTLAARLAASGPDAGAREAAVLGMRMCDPSCGAGAFLFPVVERLAEQLLIERQSGIAETGGTAAEPARRAIIDVVESCVFGVDSDATAVALSRVGLWLSACGGEERREETEKVGRPEAERAMRAVERAVVADDALLGAAFRDETAGRWRRFDVVVGNPPFLNQLETATVHSRRRDAAVRARLGEAIRSYTDASATFVALGVRLTRAGGRLGFVLPQSVLAARDAAGVRREALARARLERLWAADGHVFAGANVYVCVPTFRAVEERDDDGGTEVTEPAPAGAVLLRLADRRDPTRVVRTAEGRLDEAAMAGEPWSELLASMRGVPPAVVVKGGTLAAIAAATADFRDQYYGLAGALVESEALGTGAGGGCDATGGCGMVRAIDAESSVEMSFPRVATTGLIDPAACWWGEVETRLLKERWRSPRVDREAVASRDGELGAWLTTRLRPKVMLATQTRVVEAYVDAEGRYVPCTPVVSVTPRNAGDGHGSGASWFEADEALWLIAAAVSSPVVSAWAMRRHAGAAMHADALKLAAREVAALPLPSDRGAWRSAGAIFRAVQDARASAGPRSDAAYLREAFGEFAEAGCAAYGVTGEDRRETCGWWLGRLEKRRAPRRPERARSESGAPAPPRQTD